MLIIQGATGAIMTEKITEKAALEWVQQDGLFLENVPEEVKTAEICIEAVKEHVSALQYVPEKFKTSELCRIAVQKYGPSLEYVPEEIKKEMRRAIGLRSYYWHRMTISLRQMFLKN